MTTTNQGGGVPDARTAGRRFGRYEVLRKLATGGMGEVYLARSVGAAGFRKHVVIKRILPHLVEHEHFVSGLVREAKLMVLLEHPNIVQVIDFSQENSDYFMVMEFVHGYNLATIAHYAASRKILIPVEACAAIAMGVLGALGYAHSLRSADGDRQNVIHRDVSPQNVMISRYGQVKLTDFGIAKVLSEAEGELTQSLKGKFRYMAPEAVDGGRIDQRYDLFAVGILLYESLCRRHLFGGRSDVEILKQVRMAKVPAMDRYHPGIPPALVEVTERALHKKPAERYANAAEFSSAIRDAIAPIAEADAQQKLRAFVAEVYEKDDFPLNKPKVPDPDKVEVELVERNAEKAGSGMIHQPTIQESNMGSISVADPGPGRSAVALLSVALIAISAVVAYLLYATVHRRVSAPSPSSPVVIVSSKKQADTRPSVSREDGSSRRSAEDREGEGEGEGNVGRSADPLPAKPRTVVKTRPLGSKRRRQKAQRRRAQRPAPVEFTRQIGQKAFARRSAEIRRCFDKHVEANAQELRLKVFSEISSSGKVSVVRIEPKGGERTPLGSCIKRIAYRVRYPRHDRPTVTFLQPLTVRRSGS